MANIAGRPTNIVPQITIGVGALKITATEAGADISSRAQDGGAGTISVPKMTTTVPIVSGAQLATKAYVDSRVAGMVWIQKIDRFFDFSLADHSAIVVGGRYISLTSSDIFIKDCVYECDALSPEPMYTEYIPHEGDCAIVVGDPGPPNDSYQYSGAALGWISFGVTVQYDSIQGIPSNSAAALSTTGTPTFSGLIVPGVSIAGRAVVTSTNDCDAASPAVSVAGGIAVGAASRIASLTVTSALSAGTLAVSGGNYQTVSENSNQRRVWRVNAADSKYAQLAADGAAQAAELGTNFSALNLVSGATVSVPQTTASTTTGTGALVVAGGLGVAGAVNCATLSSTGAANIAGVATISSTTSGGTTTSGALVVAGGMGLAGRLVAGWFVTAPNYVRNVAAVTAGSSLTMTINSPGRIMVTGSGATLTLPAIQSYSGGLNYRVSFTPSTGSLTIKEATGTTLTTIWGGRELVIDSLFSGTPDVWGITSLPYDMSVSATITGAHSGFVNLSYARAGRVLVVNLFGFSFTAASNAPLTITPPTNMGFDAAARTVVILSTGLADISVSGVITLYASITGANFVSGTAYTILTSSASYIAATY